MANRPPILRRRGVSPIETMVVVSSIGILASMGVPRLELAVEQSRANIARANLRAIRMGQRAYWLQDNAFAPDLTTLRAGHLLDPGIVDDTGDSAAPGLAYVYQVGQFDLSPSTLQRVNSASCHPAGDRRRPGRSPRPRRRDPGHGRPGLLPRQLHPGRRLGHLVGRLEEVDRLPGPGRAGRPGRLPHDALPLRPPTRPRRRE